MHELLGCIGFGYQAGNVLLLSRTLGLVSLQQLPPLQPSRSAATRSPMLTPLSVTPCLTPGQVLAAEVFVEMARERVMPAYDLQVCLLPIICRNINKEKSEEVRNAGAKSKRGSSCVWCARSGTS